MKTDKSKIIVIEGPDGAGKTQLITDMRKYINNCTEWHAKNLNFPYHKSFGYRKLREILSSDNNTIPSDIVQSLFILNMIDTNENFINKIYCNSRDILFLDRSIISTIIYNTDGSILNMITNHIRKKHNNIYYKVNFDIISKEYMNLQNPVDHIYILLPPLNIILNNIENRSKSEDIDCNDKSDKVKEHYKLYQMFYDGLTDEEKNTKFTLLDKWDDLLSIRDNYTNIRKAIIDDILP